MLVFRAMPTLILPTTTICHRRHSSICRRSHILCRQFFIVGIYIICRRSDIICRQFFIVGIYIICRRSDIICRQLFTVGNSNICRRSKIMPTVFHRRHLKYMSTANALVNFSQRRQLLAVGTYIYRRSYIRPSGFYARLI